LGDNIWLGLLLAPILGVMMSFVPCCLAHAGLAVRCVHGDSTRQRVGNSLLFSLGGVLVFVAVAVVVFLAGVGLRQYEWLFHILVGTLLIITVAWALFFDTRHKKHSAQAIQAQSHNDDNGGHQLFSDEQDDGCGCNVHKGTSTQNSPRVLAHGAAGAVFAFPCSIPVLLAIIAFSMQSGNSAGGIAMIGLYIVGHNILPFVAGVSAKKLFKNDGVGSKVFGVLKIVMLILLAIFAVVTVLEGFWELIEPGHMH
jgi:cytochrome c biogenesis protein CcdA